MEQIMGAQNFNFSPKFHKIRDSQPQILNFQKKSFGLEENFPIG